jgi:ABC-type lipoprotein release transport system permease subunit
MILWTYAWRNLLRNGRRTLLTAGSIAFGLAAVMFGQSLLRSFQRQMIEKATGVMLGHVQIQNAAAVDRKLPEKLLPSQAPWRERLAADPEVTETGARILYTGLVYSAAASRGVLVAGVEPDAERRLSIIPGYMHEGAYLSENPRDIVLGAQLAKDLDVRLGERLVVMAQSRKEGEGMNSELFRLAGIFKTDSTAYDGQIVYLGLEQAQRIRGQEGAVSHLVAKLKDPRRAEAFAAERSESLGGGGAGVYSYRDVGAEIVGIQKFQDALLVVILVVIFSIVGLGILNTISMSYFERIREFGVLRAVGARPGTLYRLLLAEAVILGALGVAGGMALGAGAIGFFGHVGLALPLGKAMSYFMPFDDVIFMRAQWAMHAWSAFGLFGVCVAAAVGPAVRGGRLVVSDALRHV